MTAKVHSLRCPFCEVYELEPFGHNSVRCVTCGCFLIGTLLETLRRIVELPDAVGSHACECGHPEMNACQTKFIGVLPATRRFFPHRSGLRLPRRVRRHRGDPTRAASGTA
jgi:hypothetical protein